MDELAVFLRPLFETGTVRFDGPPRPARPPLDESRASLRARYERVCLDLAGPAPAFQESVAIAAAEWLRQACWALVDRSEPPETLAQRFQADREPSRPDDHLSADLCLRFLPGVYRRARAMDRSDPLAEILAGILRAWPLSGVLAGLDDGPSEPPDFGDHAGIAMLYAERFAARPKPAWKPAGRTLAMLEWVSAGASPPRAGGFDS